MFLTLESFWVFIADCLLKIDWRWSQCYFSCSESSNICAALSSYIYLVVLDLQHIVFPSSPFLNTWAKKLGFRLPEIYVLLLANITAVRDYLYLHCRELFSNQTFYFWTPCQSIFNRRSTINTKYDYNLGNTNKNLKKCRNNNFHIKKFSS